MSNKIVFTIVFHKAFSQSFFTVVYSVSYFELKVKADKNKQIILSPLDQDDKW